MNKKPKIHYTLTFTLAMAFLALSAAVLLISTSLQMYFSFKAQRSIIAGRQLLVANDAANTVRGFLQEKSNLLKAATYVYPSNNSTESQKLILEKLIGFEPAFRQIVLFDANGNETHRSSRLSNLLASQMTSQLNQIKDVMQVKTSENKSYLGPVYIDNITSEPMMIMAVAIKDVFGDLRGMLAAEVNLKFMWDVVGSIKIGENGQAYVVDRTGRLIAHRDVGRILKGENLSGIAEVSEYISNSKISGASGAHLSKGIGGKWIAGTHVRLGTPDWAVIVEQPVLEIYAPILDSMRLSLLTITFSFALAIAAGIYLAKKITQPIIQLKDAARKIGEGNLHTKVHIKAENEIGQLAASINQMAENLDKITVSRDTLKCEVQLRTAAQQELQQTAEKLKTANQELQNFVYIASHDLREPLRTISSFGILLEKSLKGHLSGDDAQSLHYMIDGAKRMGQMIEGLLNYSRVNTKKIEFEKVELDEIVSELKQYELNALLRETQTTLNIPKKLPAVMADAIQIRQLLQNLISNGIKYQPKGNKPEITITSKPAADGMVRIEVADNGIGIAPQYHSAIFAMFKRLHNKREYEGAGIGLAVCQRIVLRHNGTIGVDSQQGKGSTFWFTLPADNTAAATNKNMQTTETL